VLNKILAWVSGLLLIMVGFLKVRNSSLKQDIAEQELEDEKAARELSNNATEALVRGLKDESTNSGRSYKFGE